MKKPDAKDWDPSKKESIRHLRNIGDTKVWDLCTVPESDFEKGFPCLDGRLPRLEPR